MALRRAALAPGTWSNRERNVTRYIAHMRARGPDYLNPTAYDIAHYTASLHWELPFQPPSPTPSRGRVPGPGSRAPLKLHSPSPWPTL